MGSLPRYRTARTIDAWAPVRICDVGGWTDTWFARHGCVFNIAVSPGVEVRISARPRAISEPHVTLHAVNYGERYAVEPTREGGGPHPLLEAAIADLAPPPDTAVEVSVRSDVPPGCGTGTSAAVMVALVAALDRLGGGGMTPADIAQRAHRIEVERLGLQSGIQDQWAAALGGINLIEIDAYPEARVSPVKVSPEAWRDLDRRLLLVYLGKAHRSSAVHDLVIASLARDGEASPRLEALRRTAGRSAAALTRGDFALLGEAMRDNTAAQAALHPDLVGTQARALIALARDRDVPGWKVNGAGGDGGAVTLLCGDSDRGRRDLVGAIAAAFPAFRIIPTTVSPFGVRVTDTACP